MAKDFDSMEDSNRSSNPSIHQVSDPARRQWLRGGLGAAVGGLLSPIAVRGGALSALLAGCTSGAGRSEALLGFKSVAIGVTDAVSLPEGYIAQVLAPWGEPVGDLGQPAGEPAFRFDAGNSAADQALQMGMHHDGMAFFPIDGADGHGLLVMNHEYADHGLLFPDGGLDWDAEKTAKSQAAHGFSVIEIRRQADGAWRQQRPSRYARRITASTPMQIGGPAAGHPLMRTAADPEGRRVLGTFANCAAARTPWGSYVAGEENFIGYFRGPNRPTADQRRWGARPGEQWGYRWVEHDERFDMTAHPNEVHRFGWVVEFDPYDPRGVPVKRTALGRAVHEGATVAMTRDGRAVVYSGEDARFEYIYKFVSKGRMQPGGFKANSGLLDEGRLYAARFDADGRGRWLPLVWGEQGLGPETGFADQGEVLVRARQASDHLGATRMDRPEWIAVDPQGKVYCTLTNNSQRGAPGKPGVDAANPRANNVGGHIIRWEEDGDFDAETFAWSHFVLAGDPQAERDEARGRMQGDAFACPDGLFADARGLLWIQTDMSSADMGRGIAFLREQGQEPAAQELAGLGNNMLLAADPASGEIRRFLVAPPGAEVTGCTLTPDSRTMFVNIQHPGETPGDRSDPANPRLFSNWPDQRPDGRPRSATLAIRRRDGGLIGS